MKMNNLEKGKNIAIIMLSIVSIITLGFIFYDKFLIKEKTIKQECNCPKCEESNIETKKGKPEQVMLICELDMKDKRELDVGSLCNEQGISNANNVKVKNISINDKNYVLFHEFIPFYDSKGTYINFNGITKLYLNGILLDVYKGQNRETLWKIRIDGNKLIISETWPSEAPPVDYTYDLENFNYGGYTYDLKDLM